jgi:hypothetical protein
VALSVCPGKIYVGMTTPSVDSASPRFEPVLRPARPMHNVSLAKLQFANDNNEAAEIKELRAEVEVLRVAAPQERANISP